jgi:uncharacterized protein
MRANSNAARRLVGRTALRIATLAAILSVCAAAMASQARAQPAPPGELPAPGERPTLTVSGSARVAADPDQAVVRLGVAAQAAEAAAVQDRVNEVMQQVFEAVTALGISEQAVRTEELSLFPLYDPRRQPRPEPAAEPEEPRIIGYRASNVVSVRVDELGRIGEVIDAGLEAGANQLQGISFRLRDDAAARARAMQQAVQDTRTQAEAVAEAMDMRLDGVAQVVAGGYDVRPPVPFAEARVDIAATPVQPGQVDVSASVTVTYYMRREGD